jgi:alpha-L-arabinofuranosidase
MLAVAADGPAQVALTVRVDQPGAKINPAMWGIFFEDVNFGADGGLYAELVKNRSFEFPDALMGWSKVALQGAAGSLTVRDQDPFNPANPHYVRVQSDSPAGVGVSNEGFSGLGVREGQGYDFSTMARAVAGNPLALRVELVSPTGNVLASAHLDGLTAKWQKHSVTLRPKATEANARLRVLIEGKGALDLDMVSLFPRKTWKSRPGGLRADLVQMLAELKPGFMRFPGGCIVEGRYLATRYQWKSTIGAPEERKLIINRWNDEFKHRPAPDYFQSFGLGFFEFFQLCEDIGAAPLPILNCGMACQFNSNELVPLDQLEPYIQDALDLIEFANGPATSEWGRRRAALGHPQPFNMKLLGVGNEQWGPQYVERYAPFAKVLKTKHPEIQLVSSAGPSPDDERFHFLWPKLRELRADIVDEHCYATPDWFLNNTGRYDRYDRHGPKVFMGEYAAQSVKVVSPDNRNDWGCALAEAAYMLGLERNADAVVMASYAPLFAHADRWQWRPNLIWFDNLRAYGTPSYYVQQLFCCNRGDLLLPTTLTGAPTATNQQPRLYASASRDERAGEIILKVVNASPGHVRAMLRFQGVTKLAATGTKITLTSPRLNDENSLTEPLKVAPAKARLEGAATEFSCGFNPYSLTVLRLPLIR